MHPMINVAIKAARAAGAIINRAALDVESVRVSQKQANDFVTEVDWTGVVTGLFTGTITIGDFTGVIVPV